MPFSPFLEALLNRAQDCPQTCRRLIDYHDFPRMKGRKAKAIVIFCTAKQFGQCHLWCANRRMAENCKCLSCVCVLLYIQSKNKATKELFFVSAFERGGCFLHRNNFLERPSYSWCVATRKRLVIYFRQTGDFVRCVGPKCCSRDRR